MDLRPIIVLATISAIHCNPIITSYSLDLSPNVYNALHASPAIVPAPFADVPLAHPAVVENAAIESQLPPELLNPFYKNPAIAAGLAKESWFTNKEFPVHNREADRISRTEIVKLISRLHAVS